MFKPCERFVKTRPYGRIAFACVQETRHRFHDDLAALEAQALDGLDLVIQQLDRSLESISYPDVELVGMVAVEVGDNLGLREWAMFMILVARCLERIGDNTVDIAEQTVFVVTGLFREFTDASQPG